MSVQEFFAASGPLGGLFPGYAPRKGQLDMALDIEDALSTGGVVMAEGPTGTGKSLAYLVPAIEWAKQEAGRTVVVCTANIALQEQLVQKDLPLLEEAIGDFRFALAKGRNNYLCLDRLAKTIAKYHGENPSTEMDALLAWAEASGLDANARGDVSELPFVPDSKNWRRLSVMSDECKGKPCPSYGSCYSVKAKKALDFSHVIVANYAVVFLNALLRKETGMDLVLPTHQVLILDEAHKAADIARDHFGVKLRHTQVEWVTRFATTSGGKIGETARDLVKCSERFFRSLTEYRKSKSYRTRLRTPGTIAGLGGGPLAAGLQMLAETYATIAKNTSDRDDAITLRNGHKNALKHAAALLAADVLEDKDQVFFIDEIADRGTSELCVRPIHIGPLLKELVFDHVETTVITSATIAVEPADPSDSKFRYISGELGLSPTHEIVAESPFDWQNNAQFVGVESMPEPNDASFNAAMCATVVDVIDQAQGRTLCLFTSHSRLNQAHAAVKRAGLPYRILKQGDMPRIQLVEAFKKDVSSVLMGTESFWAGVDVPGESLSCVVIDRIPFPTPDDPVLDALGDMGVNTFTEYSIPRAVTQLKQGAGRLLRAVTDRGVIVCLDRRIFTKGYGKKFLKSLPAMSYSRDVETVGEFLAEPA